MQKYINCFFSHSENPPACFYYLSFVSFIYLDKIIEGTKKIKNGNINHKIEVKGNDRLATFAQDINNLSEGLENAIDEKFKSERMKAELITNVSHDLKTPLTSIINYVNILELNNLTEEEW